MESMRQGNQWLGATAKAFWGNPVFGLATNPVPATFAAWGEVMERSYSRIETKPDWGIDSVVSKGREYVVNEVTIIDKPFCNLVQFQTGRPRPMDRRVLLVAPMSGHYATLLRKTVASLLPNCEVYVTDWGNARDIPVSKGSFDVEDYAKYVSEFVTELGSDIHVIAVCQPVPLTLAAIAHIAENNPDAQPATMTLMGGPVDPLAGPTDVSDFSEKVTIEQLKSSVIHAVGVGHPGIGRKVYPGAIQLASFMSMNAQTHADSFTKQIISVTNGEAADHDPHNLFYDEYLAVMDMPAEFYLSTVERIFKNREIATNNFTIDGKHVDIGKITKTAVMVVEGEEDDIAGPGQCFAALGLLTGIPESKKAAHLEPGAGHYGIFSGKAWREDIRPWVLEFIDAHGGTKAQIQSPPAPKAARAQNGKAAKSQ